MKITLLSIFSLIIYFSNAQVRLKVIDKVSGKSIAGVSVSISNQAIAQSDSLGELTLGAIPLEDVNFSAIGYEPLSLVIHKNNAEITLVAMTSKLSSLDEVIIVSSTRSDQQIESAPIKVEVLGKEEMMEESTVKPATILGIIGDISGVQIQQTSAVSGNSAVRIQGLDGRYTQVLKDGLPLYEGFSGGFGLMSIPPLDLKQIELIKGSASTLYGAGAIGGLVNMISKRPSSKQECIITLNQTTLKETNLNMYFSKKSKKIGYTFYVGGTNQNESDVNNDGFSDISKTQSLVVHPKLFYYPNEKSTIALGFTQTLENRNGGDMNVLAGNSDSLHQFYEYNKLNRNSLDFLAEHNFNNQKLTVKSSLSNFNRNIENNDFAIRANQFDYFSEASYLFTHNKISIVSGVNYLGNQFTKLSGDSMYINQNNNNTIGIFSQLSYRWKEKSTIEFGLRDDHQNKYGNFLLPRVALFHQLNSYWGVRAGFGVGYKTPDPFTPQLKEYAINKILPINANLEAEKSYGYNADINFNTKFDEENSIFINQSFFLTQIDHPLVANEDTAGKVSFSNAQRPIITQGFDTYMKLHLFDWELYAGCTYTIAERKYLDSNQFIPYTPKVRLAFMLTKEWEGKGRFCIESSYNGSQIREDNSTTPSYFFFAAMLQYKVQKHVDVVLNVENLFDYKQSKEESLFTGNIAHPEFKTLWAPIDGRSINLCVKYTL